MTSSLQNGQFVVAMANYKIIYIILIGTYIRLSMCNWKFGETYLLYILPYIGDGLLAGPNQDPNVTPCIRNVRVLICCSFDQSTKKKFGKTKDNKTVEPETSNTVNIFFANPTCNFFSHKLAAIRIAAIQNHAWRICQMEWKFNHSIVLADTYVLMFFCCWMKPTS